MLARQVLLLIFGSPLVALASPLVANADTYDVAPTGEFGLYAYGGKIGGAQVFYSRDGAFIGDQSEMADDEEAARVVFTLSAGNELVGNPDKSTAKIAPTWSNKAFFVPRSTSPSHRVGFRSEDTSDPDPDADTSGFVFYGATALHRDAGSNTLHGLWYAAPTQGTKIWALRWNATGDDDDAEGRVLVTLRNEPPAKPFDRA